VNPAVHPLQLALQAIATFALVGAFVYAAIQFREYRRALRVANFTKLVELQMGLRRMRVDDPSLAAVYAHDIEGMPTDREIREYFFNLMQLSVFEIVWYAEREGQVPRDYFESWISRMRKIAVEPSFQRMLRGANVIVHDDFQSYVRALVRSEAGAGVDGL
jgi:hypothetical protein